LAAALMKHLYHLFKRPPHYLTMTSIGFSLCGKRLPRKQLTRHPDDTTCPKCKKLVQKEQR
jgi:hypothetical protein